MSTKQTEPPETPPLQRLVEQITQHLDTQREYWSLVAAEKISGALASMASILTAAVFVAIALSFFSIGFALWLGDWLGNRAGGFALAGLLFIPLAIGAYIWVKPFVREKIIQNLLEDDDSENQS